MPDRGAVYFYDRARQQRDYTGLIFGNITPTDIDGVIEYKGKGYVILELKYGDNDTPFGQRLALERLTDDLSKAGKPTLCIIASHLTECDTDINAANTIVIEYRYKNKWVRADKVIRTKNLITRFLNYLTTKATL